MEEIQYKDLKALSEKDRLYSLALSPVTSGVISLVLFNVVLGFGLYGIMYTVFIIMIVSLIHILLGWQDYSSNWKYYYVARSGNDSYHIVKDGARRVRVIKESCGVFSDVGNNQVYASQGLKDWLKTDKPILGDLNVKRNNVNFSDI